MAKSTQRAQMVAVWDNCESAWDMHSMWSAHNRSRLLEPDMRLVMFHVACRMGEDELSEQRGSQVIHWSAPLGDVDSVRAWLRKDVGTNLSHKIRSDYMRCLYANPYIKEKKVDPRWLSSTVVDLALAVQGGFICNKCRRFDFEQSGLCPCGGIAVFNKPDFSRMRILSDALGGCRLWPRLRSIRVIYHGALPG